MKNPNFTIVPANDTLSCNKSQVDYSFSISLIVKRHIARTGHINHIGSTQKILECLWPDIINILRNIDNISNESDMGL